MERDEERVREALYGPQTRSGQVTSYGPIPSTVMAVEAATGDPGDYIVVEPWCDWDGIRWDWPVHTEIRMDRGGCDY